MGFSLQKYFYHKRLQQVGSLYISMIINIALAFVISVINTRTLGPGGYGDYKFIINLFLFFATISSFGFTVTSSQLIAQMKPGDDRKHHLIGANFIIAAAVALLFILIIIIISILQPHFLENDLVGVIVIFSPFVFVFIFNPLVDQILQGDNKIHELSIFRVLPNAVFMVGLLAVKYFYHLDLQITVILQFIVGVGTIIVFYRKLRPDYTNYLQSMKMIWAANKKYGLHVYTGSLSGVTTTYLSTFMISYFLDNTHVGYFSLALSLTMPLLQIPSIVGTTYFKEFAHLDKLPKKVTVVTILVTGVSVIIFILLIKSVILLVYTDKFISVAYISSIIAISSAIYGLGDYFNRFLGAHGKGKQLRNGAIACGVVNILGYYFLIKYFGIDGAIVTKLIAGMVYCGMMIFYYIRFRPGKKSADHEPAEVIMYNDMS